MPKEEIEIDANATSQAALSQSLVLSDNGDVVLKNADLTGLLHDKVASALADPDVTSLKIGLSVDF